MAAKAFDEMNSATDSIRAPYRGVADWLARTSPEKVAATRHEVDVFYRRHGITFGAYGSVDGSETTIPFDITSKIPGTYHSVASMTSDQTPGTTQVSQELTVTP